MGLVRTLRNAPATVPAFAALALLVSWAADQGGYPVTHWAPGALIVLALLGLTLVSSPPRVAELPTAVKLAIGCLAAYTVLSFLSILWAGVPGDAWDGANRTLLYLLVFTLFAGWRQRGASAALLLCGWTLALIALAAFAALHVNGSASLAGTFPGGRLIYPLGYPNGAAAQWLMAFWPALLLARSARLHWALRALLAGGAVLLGDVALLSQSRGSLYATPVMLLLAFSLLPGRVRTFAALVPIALGIGVTAPAVLRVGDHLQSGANGGAALHSATIAMFAAALLVALAVGAWAEIETRRTFSAHAAARMHRTVGGVAIATLLVVLVGGLVAAGDPIARIRSGVHTFKTGYSADSSGNRLISGLGSNRYDFYRVAVDQFDSHPIVGIGADNFAQQYLRHGRSAETPHYPHSVELRTLTETGLVGGLLGLLGSCAALTACAAAIRRAPDELARVVAAAALSGFAYWVAHGSVDWFWEFAGLGAPAFALLGIGCSLAGSEQESSLAGSEHEGSLAGSERESSPAGLGKKMVLRARATRTRDARARSTYFWKASLRASLVIVALAAAGSLLAPWLAQRQLQHAARVWPRAPLTAYAELQSAAALDPLSSSAQLTAGSIALRFNDFARADHQFALALRRTPDDAYATLERGAIASQLGARSRALRLLRRAVVLNPRDPLARQALARVEHGARVDVTALNRSILLKAQQLS
jgi:tetratricopeptide (TPR) repeat protein